MLTGIQTNLVHNRDAGVLGLLVELHHGGRDVAGGDDMLLLADGGLYDGGVEGIGDQADDKVMLGDLGVEGLVVGDIEGDGGRVLDALRQLLGRCLGPACDCDGDASLAQHVQGRPSDEPGAEHEHLAVKSSSVVCQDA